MKGDYSTLKRLVCYLEDRDFPLDGKIYIFEDLIEDKGLYRLDFFVNSELLNEHFFKNYDINIEKVGKEK